LKDEKCDGCGLDPHTVDCVKETNQQQRREEMGPRLQILNRQLEKTTDKEERVRLLQSFGEEQGRLVLDSCRGRGNARGGGKGAGGHGHVQGGGRGESGHRVTTTTAPTVAVVSDTVQGDKATVKQITTPMTEKMTPNDQEICKKHNICKLHAVYGDCKFGTLCRSSYLSETERVPVGDRTKD
jgi:hypothetical protein